MNFKTDAERRVFRDEFVKAHLDATGENLLKLPKTAKKEYYDLLRKDMRLKLVLDEKDTIFSAATFRDIIFRLDIMRFATATVLTIERYVKAVNKQVTIDRENNVTEDSENDDDFAQILNLYPGLGKALLYLLAFWKIYRAQVSWEAVLIIADYYNGDNNISKNFFQLNQKEPFVQKLTKYIKVRQLEVPYKVVHAFEFTEVALSYEEHFYKEAVEKISFFNAIEINGKLHHFNTIKNEILKVLIENEELFSAGALARHFTQKNLYGHLTPKLKAFSEKLDGLYREYWFSYELELDALLNTFYSQVKDFRFGAPNWATRILWLMILFPFKDDNILIVIYKLRKKGCLTYFIRKIIETTNDLSFDKRVEEVKRLKKNLMKIYYNEGIVPSEFFRAKLLSKYYNID